MFLKLTERYLKVSKIVTTCPYAFIVTKLIAQLKKTKCRLCGEGEGFLNQKVIVFKLSLDLSEERSKPCFKKCTGWIFYADQHQPTNYAARWRWRNRSFILQWSRSRVALTLADTHRSRCIWPIPSSIHSKKQHRLTCYQVEGNLLSTRRFSVQFKDADTQIHATKKREHKQNHTDLTNQKKNTSVNSATATLLILIH